MKMLTELPPDLLPSTQRLTAHSGNLQHYFLRKFKNLVIPVCVSKPWKLGSGTSEEMILTWWIYSLVNSNPL